MSQALASADVRWWAGPGAFGAKIAKIHQGKPAQDGDDEDRRHDNETDGHLYGLSQEEESKCGDCSRDKKEDNPCRGTDQAANRSHIE